MKTLTVSSVEKKRQTPSGKEMVDHRLVVKAWNEHTNRYEEIWQMVRSEPFVAQVEVTSLAKME